MKVINWGKESQGLKRFITLQSLLKIIFALCFQKSDGRKNGTCLKALLLYVTRSRGGDNRKFCDNKRKCLSMINDVITSKRKI